MQRETWSVVLGGGDYYELESGLSALRLTPFANSDRLLCTVPFSLPAKAPHLQRDHNPNCVGKGRGGLDECQDG